MLLIYVRVFVIPLVVVGKFTCNFIIIVISERKNLNYENADNVVSAYDEYNNGIELERDEELENSDDFFDYDDDFTEDTVSTEDTEDNIYNDYRTASTKTKPTHKLMFPNQMVS